MKISVAIVAYNEEKHLEDCLKSVTWADEIVVLDGKSSDNTAKIAKKYTSKVFEVENQPLMKKMMNQAFEKCTGDWILQLDADERISLELKTEIQKVLQNPDFIAYRIPRKNLMFGKYLEHTGWYPDYQLRLFENGCGQYPAKNVHEELETKGEIGYLEKPMLHLNWETVSQFLLRLDSYTSHEAESVSKKVDWTDAIKFPFNEFLTRFFAQQGYKDGLHGLVLSLLMAFYWEVVFVKIWEKEGFWNHGGKNFRKEVITETKNVSYQWNYWLTASSQNLLEKSVRKIWLKLKFL